MSGADGEEIARYWPDTIWTGSAGCTWAECNPHRLAVESLETFEMVGRTSSLLAGYDHDRLALGQLNMMWMG
jgi:hypothetical protein